MREVKRTEEMERQLRYFHSQIHAYNELAPKEGKETLALVPAPDDVRYLQLDDLAVRTPNACRKPRSEEKRATASSHRENRERLVSFSFDLSDEALCCFLPALQCLSTCLASLCSCPAIICRKRSD